VLLLCAAAANLGGLVWWRNIFLADWLVLAALYVIASITSAVSIARREGWRFLPSLPVVFAAYHLPYAVGFLLAILYRPAVRDLPNPVRKMLTAITR
jgi:hypothetical protein